MDMNTLSDRLLNNYHLIGDKQKFREELKKQKK